MNMATITELASEIVLAHASNTSMTKDELIAELKEVHAVLTALEMGEAVPASVSAEEEQESAAPAVTLRKAFGKKQVFCMICGKGFTTLKRHLGAAHDITPKEYRKQFGIPAGTTLASKDYSESRRQMAIDKNLAGGLAKARAAKGKKK
jgi:predicted transcriptional regulator